MTELEDLMQEYFRLKDADKNVRAERNKYMQTHRCKNAERPNTDFKNEYDYQDNGGECIYLTVGMGGYPAPLCEVCTQRNIWYELRQSYGRRRSQIIRKVRRLVEAIPDDTTPVTTAASPDPDDK